MANPTYRRPQGPVSEETTIIAFHAFLQGALAQAHAEHLVDDQVLSSVDDADVQVLGPSIALFVAALKSSGDPPSITTPHVRLSESTCPPSFLKWFRMWARAVPKIVALGEEQRHDLARCLCDLEPVGQPLLPVIGELARDLKAIAIEISQRRTFQERFNEDLQYAIESGAWGRPANEVPSRPSARYRPPPAYDERSQAVQPDAKPAASLPSPPPMFDTSPLRPSPPRHVRLAEHSPPPSPSDDAAMAIIRETLYAAMTDVLFSTPSLLSVLRSRHSTPGTLSRAYFAAVSLSLLQIALDQIDPSSGRAQVVRLDPRQPATMSVSDCPAHLRGILHSLVEIALPARNLADGDDTRAMRAAASGLASVEDPEDDDGGGPMPRMERLRAELEKGPDWEVDEGRQRPNSPRGEVRALANRINALAGQIGRIEKFRERETALFEVLVPEFASWRGRTSTMVARDRRQR